MLLGVEFGQKYYRLHMGGPGKHVHGHGLFRAVARLMQTADVPGQGRRVTGDIDHPGGGHIGDGVADFGGEAFAGRVHTDHVGAEPLHGQVLGRRARVAAEKIRIGDAVPGGVGLGVGDGGGNDLRTDDLARAPGHDQRDGTDTAVEVQHQLVPGESGKRQGLFIEDLCLVPIHLVEGGDRDAEGEAAEGVVQPGMAPEGPQLPPQHHIGPLLIDRYRHAGQPRRGGAEGRDQRLLPGEGFGAVDHQAAQDLRPGEAEIEVTEQAGMGFFLIGGHTPLQHPGQNGPAEGGSGLRLEQAVLHVDHVVAPGTEEADPGAWGHGKLDLVPVAERIFRA